MSSSAQCIVFKRPDAPKTKLGASTSVVRRKFVDPLRHRPIQKVSHKHRSFPSVMPADTFPLPVSALSPQTELSLPLRSRAPFTSSTEYFDLLNRREPHQSATLASCGSALGLEIDQRGSNENLLSGFSAGAFGSRPIF